MSALYTSCNIAREAAGLLKSLQHVHVVVQPILSSKSLADVLQLQW